MAVHESDRERLKQIVSECLLRLEDEGPAALDALCLEHEDLAPAIRRRVEALAAAGLLVDDTDHDASDIPESIAGYRLVRRLGGGGMGVVYLAVQLDLGRDVALKLVRPELLYFDGARQRFAREIEVVARLRHPGIVPVHAAGEDRGVPWLAMERVEGVSLAQVVGRLSGRAPAQLTGDDLGRAIHAARDADGDDLARDASPTRSAAREAWTTCAVRIAVQAAEALEHAHARGVLHRDVKPSNLMITPACHVLLVDFGLALAEGDARITTSAGPLGSLAYMSPEQIRGQAVDGRTDVYGLGVTLYELLSLRVPYVAASHEDLRQLVLDGRPPSLRTINPAVSLELATVVATAMDRDAARRYASAQALRDDLLALLERRAIRARPPGPVLRMRRFAQRHPAATVAVVLSVLLLVGAPLTWAFAQVEANRRTTAALKRAEEHLADAQQAVDVMLSEVGHDDLEFVPGMEDVRRRLLEKALAFSRRISAREGDGPEVLATTARAAYRVGVIEMDLGDYAEAVAPLDEACRRARSLLELDPQNPDGLEFLARATNERAVVAAFLHPGESSEALSLEAQDDFERWYAITGDVEARRALADLLYRRTVVTLDRGMYAPAQELASRAEAMISSYLDAQPDDFDGRKALALILSTQGPALAGLGRPAESEAVLRRASAIQDVLLAERPQNVFVLHARSMTHMFLGRALTALDRLDEAQTELQSALGLFERVGAVAPDTPMMRAPRFLAWTALAEVQRRDGAYEDAIESFVNALTVVDAELARPDPLPRFVGHRGFISLSLANLLREAGSPRDALRMTASAETSLSEALADDPRNPSWLDALRKLHWTNALLHLDLRDPSACAVDARALHVLAGRDTTWQRTALGLLARSLDALRDSEAATTTHDELLTWIDTLIADGYTDVDDLAGSEHFAALRGTPAFEARLAELRRRLAPPSEAP